MDLSKIYPNRPEWVHKGAYGNVMVVGGSKLYTGAATLAAVAALRAGADMVTVCAPERAANVAANQTPALMTFPLKGDHFTGRHVATVLDNAHLRKINCFVIGCGLGRNVMTVGAIHNLISKISVPMVLDADALRAISQRPEIVYGKHVVLTPHVGELAILLGQSRISEDVDTRIVAAKQAALKYRAVVVLKGYVDVITDGRSLITNNTGSPFMTKGGFGDTLAGICGALLARGTGMWEAGHAAAYINGRAGEMAGEHKGEGVIASDIFDFIPRAIHTS
ncbi:NAD(P)H-hydrate dehydratase [Candidatus Curtissbacteria bacterium]|nr:NAD(P)H-hydrate dehydratase [Candidatus Curtissbacteria bacterium]